MEQLNQLTVESASKGSWVAIAAICIWLFIRVLKSDSIPVSIPAPWRPILAVGLGQAFAVLSAVLGGLSWPAAVLSGLAAAYGAVGTQEVGGAAKDVAKPPGPGMLMIVFMFVFTGCGAQEQLVKFAEGSRDLAEYAEPCMYGALEVDLARCSTPECVAEVQHKWEAPMSTLDLVKQTWCAISPSSEGCAK